MPVVARTRSALDLPCGWRGLRDMSCSLRRWQAISRKLDSKQRSWDLIAVLWYGWWSPWAVAQPACHSARVKPLMGLSLSPCSVHSSGSHVYLTDLQKGHKKYMFEKSMHGFWPFFFVLEIPFLGNFLNSPCKNLPPHKSLKLLHRYFINPITRQIINLHLNCLSHSSFLYVCMFPCGALFQVIYSCFLKCILNLYFKERSESNCAV